ncbi:MAG: MBL fold metallo-hydrolase [Bacteroidetes bacterium]|nr:MBL fold metallo-hydrolase [Bacteroidota bacterium]
MRVSVLRSGSSGNATLIEAGGVCLLVDAGISSRALGQELARRGIRALDAVLLTHEHSDHISGMDGILRRYETLVMANEATLRCLPLSPYDGQVLRTGGEQRVGPLRVQSFPVPHDSAEAVGFWLEDDTSKVCLATDLGYVPDELLDYLRAADLAVLEANYDPRSLEEGPYPPFLKARIASDVGHLSNSQAGEAIVAAGDGRLQEVWLAHLSANNNSPRLAKEAVSAQLRMAGLDAVAVRVALRDRSSLEWEGPQKWRQASLLP